MPFFNVIITEEIEYELEVEAEDKDDALDKGEAIIIEAADRNKYFLACTSRTTRITGD